MNDHSTLTEQQLNDIDARTNAATKGPWGFYDGDNYAEVAADMQVTGPGSCNYRERVAQLEDENYWDDQEHDGDDEERAPEQMVANAAFISHARMDVPALLAEVRRLRGALAEMRAARDVIASLHKDQEARLDAVNALCDREQRNAGRWENPLPVPEWVEAVRQAAAQPATHVDDRSDCNAAPAP